MLLNKKKKQRQSMPNASYMRPATALVVGFLVIILVGAILLMLPIASRSGRSVGWLTALFTATSATCVTGLTVVDTYTTYTLFGQIVTICLIQIGGLGFMLFATTTLVIMGKRISLRNRVLIRETMSLPGLSGGVRMSLKFMAIALSVELLGFVLLTVRFVPRLGYMKGIYFSFYHAVSAFCNAGFDLFGAAGSLQLFHRDPYVLLIIASLIILGGIGFAVIADVINTRGRWHPLGLHSKIVLMMTGVLILSGTALIAAVEWHNAGTLAVNGAGPLEKIYNAYFQSVTTRTAGFYSFNQEALADASKLVSAVLMLIGASPASTGGGVKTSTMFVVILVLMSVVKGREDHDIYRRRISASIARTAQSIFLVYLALMVGGAFFLTLFEDGRFTLIDLFFEEASAIGTVGLSALGTQNLRDPSKILLILFMYFGRVGPLTMMLSFSGANKKPESIHYPEEGIIVG